MKTFLLFWALFTTLSWAIPEENFETVWHNKVFPHFQSMAHGKFQGVDGKEIRYSFTYSSLNTKTLLIVPGRTEPAAKYAELIYDFKDAGYNIFIMDHRGQGESERLIKDPLKGHVNKFEDYVKDLRYFVSQYVTIISPHPIHMIAHSMGATVAAYALKTEERYFEKVVLSSPMFEINTDPYTENVAKLISTLLKTVGQAKSYAPGQKESIPELGAFEDNRYTHSSSRFKAINYLFTKYPQMQLAGPTVRWVNESLKATKNIHHVTSHVPTVLFQAEQDETVKPNRQIRYCGSMNCELVKVYGAYHEVLMEKDSIRDPILQKIKLFFGADLVPENR